MNKGTKLKFLILKEINVKINEKKHKTIKKFVSLILMSNANNIANELIVPIKKGR